MVYQIHPTGSSWHVWFHAKIDWSEAQQRSMWHIPKKQCCLSNLKLEHEQCKMINIINFDKHYQLCFFPWMFKQIHTSRPAGSNWWRCCSSPGPTGRSATNSRPVRVHHLGPEGFPGDTPDPKRAHLELSLAPGQVIHFSHPREPLGNL